MLDKDQVPMTYQGGNCCLTYTDASPSLELGISAAGGQCCITFHKSSKLDHERRKQALGAWLMFGAMICLTLILIIFSLNARSKNGTMPPGKNV